MTAPTARTHIHAPTTSDITAVPNALISDDHISPLARMAVITVLSMAPLPPETPYLTRSWLAQALGVSLPRVARLCAELRDAGYLRETPGGTARWYGEPQ